MRVFGSQTIVFLLFSASTAVTYLPIGVVIRPNTWTIESQLAGDVYPDDLAELAYTALTCVRRIE